MKNVNHFQIKKVQPQGVRICLMFCQFQPGVAYKIVAYKKSVYPMNSIVDCGEHTRLVIVRC